MRKIIDKGLELSLIFLMAFLVVDVLWQVLSRYILVSPSSVTDELAGYLLIWVGLLGAAYVSGKMSISRLIYYFNICVLPAGSSCDCLSS